MTDAIFYTAYDDMPPATVRLRRGRKPRRGSRRVAFLWSVAVALMAVSAVPALSPGSVKRPALASRHVSPLKVAGAIAVPSRVTDDPLLLPDPVAGTPSSFAESRPVSERFVFFAASPLRAVAEAPAPTVNRNVATASAEPAVPGPQVIAAADGDAADDALPSLPAPSSPLLATAVPLPTPRPTDIAPTVDHAPPFRASHRPVIVASVTPPAKASVSPDNRSFLEKFFGLGQGDGRPASPALGYAAPEDGWFAGLRSGVTANPARSYGEGTAVYEIASHTVYLPDGRRLEAHSGLGARLDDPRFVHEPMRGPTPPATYALRLRESLFHGVEALRLTPVDSRVYGRVGLLAHTYMLGPKGDSNGCVSFRDYRTFLQAFKNGDVRRLVVVGRLS